MSDNHSSQFQTILTAIKFCEESIATGSFSEDFFDLFSDDFVFEVLPPTPNVSKVDKGGVKQIVNAMLKGYARVKVWPIALTYTCC